ncbi:uncharacterized protein DS421_20g676790 [Arachis hypogaea]|nr:uncharacterized protein DS421_20g676790 [Arachis hypogaea]
MSAELPWSTSVLCRWAFARIMVITTGSSCPGIIPRPSSFVNEMVGRSEDPSSTWYTLLRCLLREDFVSPPPANPPEIIWICLSGVCGGGSLLSISSRFLFP